MSIPRKCQDEKSGKTRIEKKRDKTQACLRSRDAKQDIPVPLSHSIFDGLFVPPYALPQPRLRTSFLGSAPSRLPQWLDGAFAVLALFPLWRFARRGNSLASRLRGTTRLVLRTSVAGSGRERPLDRLQPLPALVSENPWGLGAVPIPEPFEPQQCPNARHIQWHAATLAVLRVFPP